MTSSHPRLAFPYRIWKSLPARFRSLKCFPITLGNVALKMSFLFALMHFPEKLVMKTLF